MAHFIDWISPAFKSHRAAAMRKVRIPGDIIINTLVAINAHRYAWGMEAFLILDFGIWISDWDCWNLMPSLLVGN